MSKVFISHSRLDAELTANVATMLRNIGDEPVVMEYKSGEDETTPPWSQIREGVLSADYMMLFKTENAIKTDYTKSWIVFEVGLAAATRKRLFVFEQEGPPITFPIPYLTDYMVFNPGVVGDFLEVQAIAKQVRETNRRPEEPKKPGALARVAKALSPFPSPEMLVGLMLVQAPELVILVILEAMRQVLKGPVNVKCPRCNSAYRYYAGLLDPFRCPVCLTEVRPAEEFDPELADSLRQLQGLVTARQTPSGSSEKPPSS